MAGNSTGLVDQWGMPVSQAALTEEIAGPSLTGVRSPLTSYPGDGLDPQKLAMILREADAGDPLRYLELAETIEERDLHYAGVMGTRKRSVSQLDITVEAAGKEPAQVAQADMVRQWLDRDELASELFDMLDAIGKGYSFTEIIWDTSEGDWRPQRLEWRDPRWFRFVRADMTTPVLLTEGGQEAPLKPFKFIRAVMKAKSGLPVRSGIARIAAWAFMFKAFTQRDWTIFTQTFGQPLRVGKYGPGATDKDKAALFRAVANIAADCAAIIPQSMVIDFIESKNVSASADLYEKRADWLDRQMSKAVLGQTATTDAIAGGHAVGKEHRLVQEDIERADAKELSAILNRDLIAPWIQLQFGPQEKYPRLKIGRAEQKDVKAIVDMAAKVIPMGVGIGERQMRDLIGIGVPESDDRLLTPPVFHPRASPAAPPPDDADKALAASAAPPSVTASCDISPARGEIKRKANLQDALGDAAAANAAPAVAAMLAKIRAMADSAASLEELKAMLEAADLSSADLAASMGQSLLLAHLTGQAEIGMSAPPLSGKPLAGTPSA